MATFIVEHYLPGSSAAELAEDADRVRHAGALLARHGVVHCRSVIIEDDEMCMHLFDASDASAVTFAHAQANLPCDRIVRAEVTDPG